MTLYLDSSVLVAALVEDEVAHEASLRLLRRKSVLTWSHALAETFSTLTGGRLGIRASPRMATLLIEQSLLPRLALLDLSSNDLLQALRDADAVGARGGALYDHLHLAAARKAGAREIYTLNLRHFKALARKDDPRILEPAA